MLTPEYKQQITELHHTTKWGNQGWKAMPEVLSMILKYRIKHPTVLDFGAGECTLAREMRWAMPHVQVTSYDPGMPGLDTLPRGTWDIGVCTDVMEHVEPEFVDATLDLIRVSTQYGVFFNIATKPAKQFLPDGRNAHLTVNPPAWWYEKLQRHWATIEACKGKGFAVIVSK